MLFLRVLTLFLFFCLFISRIWAGDTLRVVFTGDLLLDRGVRRMIQYHGADWLFSQSIDSIFANNEIVVANLECPITDIRQSINKRFVFCGDPSVLPVLKRHGITHLNLANNHSIDKGRDGLVDTRNNIIKNGMTPVGFGDNSIEASCPLLISSTPRNVYLLSSLLVMSENYAYLPDKPCINEATINQLCDTIRRLKYSKPGALVIVCLHWGVEHTLHPTTQQRCNARQLVDAGADAVIGHHTHTAQDVEIYEGKPIYYSLGNFIFDQSKPMNTKAILAEFVITNNSVITHTIPVLIENCKPE